MTPILQAATVAALALGTGASAIAMRQRAVPDLVILAGERSPGRARNSKFQSSRLWSWVRQITIDAAGVPAVITGTTSAG